MKELTVLESNQNKARITDDGICPTLPASMGLGGGYIQMIAYATESNEKQSQRQTLKLGLQTNHNINFMSYGLDRASFNQGKNAKYDFSVLEDEQPTLTAKGPGGVCTKGLTMDEYTVRRLTPLECERLQNFPDFWTDIAPWTDSKGKVHKDADGPRYTALGNSIATGPGSYWEFILKRISAQYTDRKPTMASLFDGIGGFPLIWNGVNGDDSTLWASEIEEFPIAVTKRHFPKMQHLGDITKIDGTKVPMVDVLVGGSPCQDLSVAGNRAGLDGERSGLFMEQIRLTKELKANGTDDNGRVFRYLLWENVVGAFSSGKYDNGTEGGADFRRVLEEVCKVADGSIVIPRPRGKWTNNGCILGNGFSVAWTVHDAKDWCVPQRRKRISLVADYRGYTAPEILFERSCVSGNKDESGEERKDPSETVGRCPDEHNKWGGRMDVTNDEVCTLRAQSHHPPLVVNDA